LLWTFTKVGRVFARQGQAGGAVCLVADDKVEIAKPCALGIGQHLDRLIGRENDDAAILGSDALRPGCQFAGVGCGRIGQIVGAKVFFVAPHLTVRTDNKGMNRIVPRRSIRATSAPQAKWTVRERARAHSGTMFSIRRRAVKVLPVPQAMMNLPRSISLKPSMTADCLLLMFADQLLGLQPDIVRGELD
jgi:hypothetical protein